MRVSKKAEPVGHRKSFGFICTINFKWKVKSTSGSFTFLCIRSDWRYYLPRICSGNRSFTWSTFEQGKLTFNRNNSALMRNWFNSLVFQGLGFTLEERQVLGIHGLQPARFKSQEEQIELCKISINRYQEDLNKYLYLVDLQVSIF